MNSIPFLRLPSSAQQLVIKLLHPFEALALSFCSKKCKSAVENAAMKIDTISIRFGHFPWITLYYSFGFRLELNFSDMANWGRRGHLEELKSVHMSFNGNHFGKWKNLNFGFDVWPRHLYSVYSGPKLTECRFAPDEFAYKAASIQKCLEGINVRTVEFRSTYRQQSFELLLNSNIVFNSLILRGVPFENEIVLRHALSQHLDYFMSDGFYPDYFSSLDNILTIDSHTIHCTNSNVSEKSLNRLLKLWMKGSMPRLEYLRFSLVRNVDQNAVMKGIGHTVTAQDVRRQVPIRIRDGHVMVTVQGGYKIARLDGVTAIIKFDIYFNRTFWFYVLN